MKRKQEWDQRAGWNTILNENYKFFQENPLSEIVLSEMNDRRYLGQNKSKWRSMIKIFVIVMISTINARIIRKNVREEKAILISYLDKENDWGLVFPIAKELEKEKQKFFLFITDEIYQCNRDKIKSLTNATVLSVSRLGDFKKSFLTCDDLILLFDHRGIIRKILKRYCLGEYVEYLDLMAGFLSMANALYNQYCSSCLFSYSLGNRILGILYQKYGIRHFAMQHGESDENTLKFWSPFTPSNVFMVFTYGEKQKEIFEEGYGTNAAAVGNMIMRNSDDEEVRKDAVVYFADMTWVKSNVEYERILKECLDEFINLYKRNKENAAFFIKPHPRDDFDYYTNYNRIFGNEIQVIRNKQSATEILKRTKVCISLGSTVNMQAIRLGSVAVQLYKRKGVFNRQEYSYTVRNLTEVDDIIVNEKLQEEIKKYQIKKIVDYDSDVEIPQLEVIKLIKKECIL